MVLELATPADLTSWRTADPATLLAAAEGLVRDHCRWHIAPQRTESLTVDGTGGPTIFLPSLHVTAVASVTVDGEALTDDQYEWFEAGYLVRTGGCWPDSPRSVVAALTHGHELVPPVVQAVVLDVANRAMAVVKAGGLVRLRVGGVDRQFGTGSDGQAVAIGLTADNKAALAPHRDLSI